MTENARETFALNLACLLEQSRFTQADLTRKLGLRQSTVSDWCGGKKYPRVDKIQLLADFFGVPRAALTEYRNGSPPSPNGPEWLRQGLKSRGVPGAGMLSDKQLGIILQNMDMLASAFYSRVENGE